MSERKTTADHEAFKKKFIDTARKVGHGTLISLEDAAEVAASISPVGSFDIETGQITWKHI